ncbi:MAG: dienelactone hydrolase family protein [Bacteroidota bacterium]|nr:dienelactone hydrolase family protein [Bacteroidota bacterium]
MLYNFIVTLFLFFTSLTVLSQNIEELISFESSNPFSLNDIIEDFDNQEKQTVFGKLVLPNDSLNPNKKFPLVIGVAGSLGWGEHHYKYLEMYQKMGIATFELNSFKSRGITSTVGTQNQVTISAMIVDAYKALEALSKHPNIDKNKISITGWSLGGGVTLFSAWMPVKNAINKELKFASHLAFYPPCFIEPENIEFSDSPIHILIGDLDNWTPAKPCSDLVNKLNKKSNIGLTIYKDSHHSFDRNSPVIRNEEAYNFSDCLFRLSEDGHIMMDYLNIPMSNPLLQKIGFMFCVTRGVNYGGNPVARKKSFTFAEEFMIKTLLK